MPARNLDHAGIGDQIVRFEMMICLEPLIIGFLRCPDAPRRMLRQCKTEKFLGEGRKGAVGRKRPETPVAPHTLL
jgi:hypothetical protein